MKSAPRTLFDTLDQQFAAFLQRLAQADSPSLALAAMLVSRATRAGHVCIHLQAPPRFEGMGGPSPNSPEFPASAEWQIELQQSPVVGRPGEFKPLVLDADGRLYLHRYWNYETLVAEGIRSRLAPSAHVSGAFPGVPGGLDALLDRYFGADDKPSEQRLAVQTALSGRFTVISGGPGTGKTYTIAVFVAALLEAMGHFSPRIALAAPTGKAAIRLQEALLAARTKLPCPSHLLERLPTTASTLHRLLGSQPGSNAFRHDAANPLPYDLIIIDEASMVDLALMAKLFQACRPATRVVLVGDMDQLASVEAGAVLGDICDGIRGGTAQGASIKVEANRSLAGCIVPLRKSYRFRDGTGMTALNEALNAGDATGALGLLSLDSAHALTRRALPSASRLADELLGPVGQHFKAILSATKPLEALQALGESRILCALRRGPFGTEAINQGLERALREDGQITSPTPFYPGRPILILKNDYSLRLFNGDVGLVWPHPDTGELRVWFLDPEGNVRDFAPGRLPEHETVFAMTVHKSQGSEFNEVLLILPDRDSPVLTRELIYTGVTRARRRIELWLHEPTFHLALARRTERTSGLAARLWK
jgi:exodeoxyribonuclease V alpha subunit